MLHMNKALLVMAASVLAGAMAAPATAAAQEPTTVTGCLSKGAGAGTFSIKDTEGKSYSLTSTTVKLDGHVGHKVTVTGTAAGLETGAVKDTTTGAGATPDTGMKHDKHAAHDTGMKKEAAVTGGALTVTSMKMESAECK
jgi:Flp pilus assembly protein TadG